MTVFLPPTAADKRHLAVADQDVASLAVRASVYAVSPTVSPDGRSIAVKLRTEPGTTALKDGMYVSAWIIVQEKERVAAP